ncbi:hypothetical protein HOD50_08795 [Candidatus Bathyarchaeota archaeon]|nr:hypothetical protein [Candidatus Bathyarchaeota archaeon]
MSGYFSHSGISRPVWPCYGEEVVEGGERDGRTATRTQGTAEPLIWTNP